jgi:hypothetical protein
MLHLAKITKIHEDDAFFYKDSDVKVGEIILWLQQDECEGWEQGHALRKNGHLIIFFAIKTRRLN